MTSAMTIYLVFVSRQSPTFRLSWENSALSMADFNVSMHLYYIAIKIMNKNKPAKLRRFLFTAIV